MHYGGFACQMDRIISLARERGLRVIEDAAHAPFGKYRFSDGRVKSLGTIGDVGCFSFFGNKNMTTGEGGMIVTDNDELAKRIKLLRTHGMTTLSYERHRGHAGDYDVMELGYNYRLDEVRSAIGLCQLAKIDSSNQKRRDIFRWYIESFADQHDVCVPFRQRDLDDATPHVMSIIVDSASELREHLRSRGIQTSRHYPLVTSFSIYASESNGTLFPSDSFVTLPLGPHMTREDVALVSESVREFHAIQAKR
jgi:dTDP-4-amino-4,6-dideoxygalactose transaminase